MKADSGTTGLAEAFRARFGAAPTHRVRAPGRVNLIGEHTDYNGLPVFPMAIQRSIRIFFRPRDDRTVRVFNADPGFEEGRFELSDSIPHRAPGDWRNYVQAVGQGMVEWRGPLRGFDGLVSGDVPVAAGLSSSSALVVAVALALARVNEIGVDRVPLAERCARFERYVGTRGGGMDQAISLGAREGFAFRIDFGPLRLAPTAVPRDWQFIVANTLVPAEKSGPSQAAYNARTLECRKALERVRQFLGSKPAPEAGPTAAAAGARPQREPRDAPQAGAPGRGALSYPDLVARWPLEELVEAGNEALPEPLRRRFRHVVTEAVRVEEARRAMENSDLERFGSLMSASHRSLRDDYEVSCEALEELVGAAVKGGAAGARLTGAGFGGCIVALCGREKTAEVMEVIQRQYYHPRGIRSGLNVHLLAVHPSDGAEVVEI